MEVEDSLEDVCEKLKRDMIEVVGPVFAADPTDENSMEALTASPTVALDMLEVIDGITQSPDLSDGAREKLLQVRSCVENFHWNLEIAIQVARASIQASQLIDNAGDLENEGNYNKFRKQATEMIMDLGQIDKAKIIIDEVRGYLIMIIDRLRRQLGINCSKYVSDPDDDRMITDDYDLELVIPAYARGANRDPKLCKTGKVLPWGFFRGRREKVFVNHVIQCLQSEECEKSVTMNIKFPDDPSFNKTKFDKREGWLILHAAKKAGIQATRPMF